MFFAQGIVVVLFIASSSLASNLTKRGVIDLGYGFDGLASFAQAQVQAQFVPKVSVSPGEIASAIQAAKEASAAVQDAQRRVHDAKEEVLHQQHVASRKQADAALALQKTEAAAAVQQQEAKAAATALVQAQQRLAHAKAEVSELQRIASAKEAHAAAIIQKSANAAAHEIARTDEAARKLSAIQSSGSAALRQASAAKQGSLTAASAAVAASDDHGSGSLGGPWLGHQKVVHLHPLGRK